MKKQLVFLLVFLLLMSLCACTAPENREEGRLSVVATIFPPYDFARSLCGDLADVTMLLSPGEETHTYDPAPADILAIQNCDVFIYGGGESDTWVEDLLSSLDTSGMTLVSMMEVCDLLEGEEEHDHEHEHDHDHDHEEAIYDEHVWTSPVNAGKIVEAVSNALCTADPDNASTYRSNRDDLLGRLEKLDQSFRETIEAAPGKLLIFGDRFPLLYFAEEYGLDYCAAFPGCASNTEPSAATVAELIDCVKAEGIPIVFKIELSNGKTAQTIAEASGARVETFYSCHTISKDAFEKGETYFSLMEKNIPLVKEALS